MNCIIIHGCNPKDREKIKEGHPPQNKRYWIPWVKEELEKKGIETFTPLMPKSWAPVYEEWKTEFEKLPTNKNSIIVAASAGGAFLVRWLGETKARIRKLILVAPAKIVDEQDKTFENFYDFEINPKIKEITPERIIFISNDSERMIKSAKFYSKNLSARLIELKRHGHFMEQQMGTREFPELLEEVLK